VTLTVHDFQLPSTPSLATAFLAFSGNICQTHTAAPSAAAPTGPPS
jgi:hypothetical protein